MTNLLWQFSRFGAVGAIGTTVHYALLIVLVETIHADAVFASIMGAGFGAFINYLLNYRYTFHSARRHRETLPRYLLIAVISLLLNAVLMRLLISDLNFHYLVSQLIATGLVLMFNFLANRHWTFGKGVS